MIKVVLKELEVARNRLAALKALGMYRGRVYIQKVKGYNYGMLILPKEICIELNEQRCTATVKDSRVEYTCSNWGEYKISKKGKVCQIRFPLLIERDVIIEKTPSGFVVYFE